MSFKMTVEIAHAGEACGPYCQFLRYGRPSECRLFDKKLRVFSIWGTDQIQRCADCKKAAQAAEKADA